MEEESSLRTSIQRWLRELTVRGDDELCREDQVKLIRDLNPPRLDHFKVPGPLEPEQRQSIHESLEKLRATMYYDQCAQLAVDEALLFMLRQATGKSRSELVEQLSIMLEEIPELRFRDQSPPNE